MSTATSSEPWVSTPLVGGPVRVRGAADLEQTADGVVVHRLPAAARAQMPDDFVRMCERQPSGVRLVLRTAAHRFELDVRAYRTVSINRPSGEPGAVPDPGQYELVADGRVLTRGSAAEHGVWGMDYRRRRAAVEPAPVCTVRLDVAGSAATGGEREVEIWLPFDEVTHLLALRTDAPVHAPSSGEHTRRPRWVHYGSSISQGAAAATPTGIWPVVAARRAELDLVNLGLSGNAVLDPFVARAIRDQPSDLITLKLGINVINHDCFRGRTFGPAVDGFLDTIREGHPTTPVVVVSPILCGLVEDRPGPTEIDPDSPSDAPVFRTLGRPEELADDKLSLGVVRELLAAVVTRRAASDPRLGYLDGRELYGRHEWESLPMADLMHPGPEAHRLMGDRFAALLPGLAPDLGADRTHPA